MFDRQQQLPHLSSNYKHSVTLTTPFTHQYHISHNTPHSRGEYSYV